MNKEVHDRWQNDPEYRKEVLRELENKYPIRFGRHEFGDIVWG